MSLAKSPGDVDQVPPPGRLVLLGLQHVLAMYAGAVAVPLIVGSAMVEAGQMSRADVPYLVSADLLVAGIASILQSVGVWRFGVRLPLMQGCTFAAVAPMIAIGARHGVTAIYGSVIACGLFMIFLAPFFSRLVRFFPPLVTGTVLLVIGLALLPVAASWAGGGAGTTSGGGPAALGCAAITLAAVVLIERLAPALGSVSVLAAMVVGTVAAIPLGLVDFHGTAAHAWFGVGTPLHFGAPTFRADAIVSMGVVALVIMTETTGDILAIGEITGVPVTARRLADGLRADGLSTVLGGLYNTFPYTAFAQNVGLVSLTGVRSRFVATAAGAMLVVLGALPKLGAAVEGLPRPVLGGAGVALFGVVAASGVRTLARQKLEHRDVLVIAISVGVGLLPTVHPHIYRELPVWFQTVFDSGISAGALTAITLNLVFTGGRGYPRAPS